MRAVVQRVSEAGVQVGDEWVARIGAGLLVLLGVEGPPQVIFHPRVPGQRFRSAHYFKPFLPCATVNDGVVHLDEGAGPLRVAGINAHAQHALPVFFG